MEISISILQQGSWLGTLEQPFKKSITEAKRSLSEVAKWPTSEPLWPSSPATKPGTQSDKFSYNLLLLWDVGETQDLSGIYISGITQRKIVAGSKKSEAFQSCVSILNDNFPVIARLDCRDLLELMPGECLWEKLSSAQDVVVQVPGQTFLHVSGILPRGFPWIQSTTMWLGVLNPASCFPRVDVPYTPQK